MRLYLLFIGLVPLLLSCSKTERTSTCLLDSTPLIELITCTDQPGILNNTVISVINDKRKIHTNGIPEHPIGQFPNEKVAHSLRENEYEYYLPLSPNVTDAPLYIHEEFRFYFGITLNGILLDPANTVPWNLRSSNDQRWTIENSTMDIGMDCHHGIVDDQGRYSYLVSPKGYIYQEGFNLDKMMLIGYAADGFPIYYKYAHKDAMDTESELVEMISGYLLRAGAREGDGLSFPCGLYDGQFTQDYEFNPIYSELDECNGRFGATVEYPDGTYYYMATSGFPILPRCFAATPDESFRK